jgi:hypothetical protein
MSQSRQWNAGRFLQTLTYFETIPVLSWLQKMFSGSTPPPPPQPQAGILFDFRQPIADLQQTWGALDDVVMGGVSASSLLSQPGVAVFTGDVSTENSGGFASVRTRNFEPPLDLSGFSGITLQVKGDGKRYKFLVRDEDTWDSIAYSHSFDTVADQWITVQILFEQLVPVFRAKTVTTSRPLEQSRIRSLQLMLSKFEYDGALNPHFSPGQFRLEIQTIAVY